VACARDPYPREAIRGATSHNAVSGKQAAFALIICRVRIHAEEPNLQTLTALILQQSSDAARLWGFSCGCFFRLLHAAGKPWTEECTETPEVRGFQGGHAAPVSPQRVVTRAAGGTLIRCRRVLFFGQVFLFEKPAGTRNRVPKHS
jgi:hypothetical protein